jgi:hypothetical protein
MSAPAANLTPDVSIVPKLPDFSERLSPMLVKELRQGLRSPLFVWGLIVMNTFLGIVVWLTVESPEEESLDRAFFGAFCVLVCGLLPLRAAGALYDELRGNTIDTLIMTRLTGWRITLGKWIAVVAQQWLATITVLPYLIVRYFAGGVNVPMELAWLGVFLLIGMASAAILTGFSWIKYFLFRAAFMMGMTFLTGAFCVTVLGEMFGHRRDYILDQIYKEISWPGMALLFLPVFHLSFFALDVGASKVGTMVENRSLRRRLIALLVLGAYAVIAVASTGKHSGYFNFRLVAAGVFGGVTFMVIGLQALLEAPVNMLPVVLPWVKRGWLGKLAARFFYPGWPSGVMFIFLLGLTAFAGWMFAYLKFDGVRGSTFDEDSFSDSNIAAAFGGWGAFVGMLVVPFVLWRVFFRKRLAWHLGTYILLLLLAVGVQMAVLTMASTTENPNMLKWGAPIPTMSWAWLSETDGGYYREDPKQYLNWGHMTIAIISGGVTLLWWLVAVLDSLFHFRGTRLVEQEAEALLKSAPADGTPPAGEH